MDVFVEPLQVQSLKAACVTRLEELILSGRLKVGEALPPERRLAEQLGVSRPVLHEALVDLAGKGLVRIVPRRGAFVSDYRTSGSVAMLTALLSYGRGELDERFLGSMMDMRLLLEVENARLAATHRTGEHLVRFRECLAQETQADRRDASALAELDFAFHQLVALASGNLMYPLVINSFKSVYTNITQRFFQENAGDGVLDEVFAYHRRLVEAIAAGDSPSAAAIMEAMLRHGAAHLK